MKINIPQFDVAFVGMVFQQKLEKFVLGLETGQPQIAASKLGWAFIDGLRSNLKGNLRVISVLMVSRFPVFRKLWIAAPSDKLSAGSDIVYAKFLNIPLLKRGLILVSVMASLLRWWLLRRSKDSRVIFAYAVYLPTIIPVAVIGKLARARVYLIIPDLPEYMQPGVKFSGLVKMVRDINVKLCYFFCQYFDGYIFLTRAMAERFPTHGKPWTVMEGCVSYPSSLPPVEGRVHSDPKTIFYSGTLNRAYGISTLLEAFELIEDPEASLLICGRGELQDEVERRSRLNSRIKYLGVLKNSEVVAIQKSCGVLVNPRGSADEYTRYSFPSKTLEYLVSGRPVVCCRLPGIPAEYWDYLIPVDQEDASGFASVIANVINRPPEELDKIGEQGRKYVLANKVPEFQIARVLKELNF